MGRLFFNQYLCLVASVVCFFSALMLTVGSPQKFYFDPSQRYTWEGARNHCQTCFKDLVTLTPENIQAILQKTSDTSESWIGLRKNFYSRSYDTSTIAGNVASTIASTYTTAVPSNVTADFTRSDTSNNKSMPWSRWANEDPLSFQNWYPGYPMFKPSPLKPVCCSCSCTCPATPTPVATSPAPTKFITANVKKFTGLGEDPTQEGRDERTQTNKECVRTPMLTPEEEEDHYIEDSCVAMLAFGAWVERNCNDLLPFICYDDPFLGPVNVSNVTTSSTILTWESPNNIGKYRIEVEGDKDLLKDETTSPFDLENLTAGTLYKVKVFPVKCTRDLNPQEVTFYTVPNMVEELIPTNVTDTSITLRWDQPEGNVDFYLIKYNSERKESLVNETVVEGLIPGGLHTFSVSSWVDDRSRWSEESNIPVYTKPGRVSNLTASQFTCNSLLLSWKQPEGNTTGYNMTAVTNNGTLISYKVDQTELEWRVTELNPGTKITVSIRALANDSLEGDEVTISSSTRPAPVSNLTVDSGNDCIHARWKAPKLNDSFFEVKLQLNKVTVQTKHNLTQTELRLDGLKNAAEYVVIVYVVFGHLYSAQVNKTIYTLPEPPTDLSVTSWNKSHISIGWKAPANTTFVQYLVSINSSFWGISYNDTVDNITNYTFKDLKSGTSYTISVQTKAGEIHSPKMTKFQFTEVDAGAFSLSMLCSSAASLLCDNATTRDNLFKELEAHFRSHLGNSVFWKLEQQTPSPRG